MKLVWENSFHTDFQTICFDQDCPPDKMGGRDCPCGGYYFCSGQLTAWVSDGGGRRTVHSGLASNMFSWHHPNYEDLAKEARRIIESALKEILPQIYAYRQWWVTTGRYLYSQAIRSPQSNTH